MRASPFFVVFLFSIAALPAQMEYVEICRVKGDCKRFSRLVMGTDHLIQGDWVGQGQPEIGEEEAFGILDESVRLGINFFDTSPIYVGGVEHKLGKWKASRREAITRDDFYEDPKSNPDRAIHVLSKGGFPFDLFWAKQLEKGTHAPELLEELVRRGVLDRSDEKSGQAPIALRNVPPGTYASRLFGSPEQIRERVAEELGHTTTNLNGSVTIYLMHRDDGDAVAFDAVVRPRAPVETLLQALSDSALSKNYWMLGWSNWQTDRIDESIRIARAKPELQRPAINSPYFSLFEMSERSIHALGVQVTHREMMDPSFQKGIRIMPYSPLGGFSILDKPEPKWENAKRAAKEKFDRGDAYWRNVYPSIFTKANEERWHRVVEFTKAFNERHGTSYTVDQMINAYALAHPRTDLLAIGPITKEQLRRTVESLGLSKNLTPEDLDYLHSGIRKARKPRR